MALRATLLILAATALIITPSANAHTEAFSVDGKVRASIGLLGEPVVTGATTGLDVCFTHAMPAPRTPIAVNETTANALLITLTAPDGATHTDGLATQFGRPGCITFDHPLVLTQPGQYKVAVRMAGSALFNGTTFALAGINAGGAVQDRGNLTFPVTDEPAATELADRIHDLESRIATLEQDLAAAQAEDKGDGSEFAPGAPAALMMIGLVALVAALRRRA